jgi:hypothetical protein
LQSAFVERLDASDDAQKFYRYTLVSGIQAIDYVGTLSVQPKGSGSVVEWKVQFWADGQPDFVVRTIVSTLQKTGFESLKARFGAS